MGREIFNVHYVSGIWSRIASYVTYVIPLRVVATLHIVFNKHNKPRNPPMYPHWCIGSTECKRTPDRNNSIVLSTLF